ncbi:MAG TPA: hypothetical protein PLP07_16005 [Pyrinomonadaceae bacterium]|nr:hypothetical protein [Chloracidobacterium sp.]MBP9108612.1 hypothetical protein [Pyrinomonadaceae bacterium]MBK7802812.1 hypothetical protein [Chloracidobacterium sp.]MBL0238980.1 hypothetical protein [Chloracidobacterium sp.]HQX57428.1 hypothetical protein [Pyrinomonadaceae bacterium]
MTNHIHLLIERRTDDVGRIMHRVLTSVRSVREDAARAWRKGKEPRKNPVAMAPGSDKSLAFAGTEGTCDGHYLTVATVDTDYRDPRFSVTRMECRDQVV